MNDDKMKSYGHGGMLPEGDPRESMNHMVGNPNAEDWTDAFCVRNPAIAWDAMIGWFANAIEAGRIAERKFQEEQRARRMEAMGLTKRPVTVDTSQLGRPGRMGEYRINGVPVSKLAQGGEVNPATIYLVGEGRGGEGMVSLADLIQAAKSRAR